MIKPKIQNPERIKLRRKQIYHGAMKVFRKKGFHSASIREIAEASRLSPGALYNYIDKKEDILYLVHEELLDNIDECLDKALQRHQDPVQRFVQVVRDTFEFSSRLKEETLFMYTESKFLEKQSLRKVLEQESRFVSRLEGLIREGVDKGVFECREPGVFANILALLMALIPLRSWNLVPYYSEKEILGELLTLLLRGLKADERSPTDSPG